MSGVLKTTDAFQQSGIYTAFPQSSTWWLTALWPMIRKALMMRYEFSNHVHGVLGALQMFFTYEYLNVNVYNCKQNKNFELYFFRVHE